MPDDHNRRPDGLITSRRSFLGTSAAVTGALVAGRWITTQAAHGKERSERSDARAATHPLDPLTSEEIEQAVGIVRRSKSLGDSWRFVSVALAEPTRPSVATYRPAEKFDRVAAVLLMDTVTGQAIEALVDLKTGEVTKYEPLAAGLQPPIMLDEFIECESAVKRSPAFRAALAKRGVTNVELVMVDPWSAGMYGTTRQRLPSRSDAAQKRSRRETPNQRCVGALLANCELNSE